jgi:crossover junction endodeoxyribonuclease RusA
VTHYELIVSAVIDGNPLPKERPRVVNGRAYTPKKTKDEEERIATLLKIASVVDIPVANDNIRLDADYFRGDRRRVDTENCAKLTMDAMNKVVVDDDSQITEIHLTMTRGDPNPRTEISVYRILEDVAA